MRWQQHPCELALRATVGLVLVAGSLALPSRPAAADCGSYRQEVRTATDAAGEIDLTASPRSVRDLRHRVTPAGIDATTRRLAPVETHVFRVHARIVHAVLEADGQIHVALSSRDNVHHRLGVTFADPTCLDGSWLQAEQVAARTAFLQACGPMDVGSPLALKGMVTVTAAGFFNVGGTESSPSPNGLELAPVLGFSGSCWRSNGSFILMATGDSVPERVTGRLADAAGWVRAGAAVGGCPVTGEEPTNERGIEWTTDLDCRDLVIPAQRRALRRYHPDIILWWDRPSISHFLTTDGDLVLSRTERFWKMRHRALERRVRVLTRGGAMVVFVGTEPIGRGAGAVSPASWQAFQMKHYADVTRRWNRIMRTYAERHPATTRFIEIASDVCNTLVAPCNDRIDGVWARPQGQHYEGPGMRLAVRLLRRDLAPIVRRLS
ncbi:MAG TPA: hypothetical protein VJM84_03425 [Actinomycetota bacterium]|nr:hypothetical protein [Actinomycetota bacterium]